MARLVGALPSGSCLIASHLTTEHDRERTAAGQAVMRDAGITMRKRDSDVFAEIAFTGLHLVPPGVALVSEWRPEDDSPRPSPSEVSIGHQLEKIQVGTFTGPAGTFRQRTEITQNQRQILKALEIDTPPRIYQLKLPAEPE